MATESIMDIGLGTGSLCLSGFLLFLVGLYFALKYGAGYDFIKEIKNMTKGDESLEMEMTEQERIENNIIEFDTTREFKLKKVLASGDESIYPISHLGFTRGGCLLFNQNQKVIEGNLKSLIVRGENLLRMLAGDSEIVIEYEDNDTYSALKKKTGQIMVENSNIRKENKELTSRVTKQIIEENEKRKEMTKARYGGVSPHEQNQQSGFNNKWGSGWNQRGGSGNEDGY